MADVVIVGHGVSLRGAGLGSTIDSYDCPIVRFNGFMHGCGVEDRGSRLDYLCTTTKQFKFFLADGVIPVREVWVYMPRNDFKLTDPYEYPLYADQLKEWLNMYRGLKTGYTVGYFCKGLAAIIIAAKRLDVNNILLFGFDNLWAGERKNFETMGLRRGKVKTTRHDYVAQRKMFDAISSVYKVSISNEVF